ncbi:proline-rich protein 2 [Fopius arisanus]|uniref:Proline-rich protein 2 n=1 Tax=Fopius arisanus TaxID=64838 RepID=A0A9R1T3W2_9HYME|nr:PREDICTED: proline-rich protein 2-like [Fopius arisanus]
MAEGPDPAGDDQRRGRGRPRKDANLPDLRVEEPTPSDTSDAHSGRSVRASRRTDERGRDAPPAFEDLPEQYQGLPPPLLRDPPPVRPDTRQLFQEPPPPFPEQPRPGRAPPSREDPPLYRGPPRGHPPRERDPDYRQHRRPVRPDPSEFRVTSDEELDG